MQGSDKRADRYQFAAAEALTYALEHPALSTGPRTLCAAACACKAWQQAVQQCRACKLQVAFELPAEIEKLENFCSWLHGHAPLVQSIKLSAEPVDERDTNPGAALLLLQQALEAAAVRTAALTPAKATAPAAAAAAAADPSSSCDQHQPQQQQLLQRSCLNLANFSSKFPFGAALLTALPAHSLTHMDLCLASGGSSGDSAAVSAALAKLTSLKQLQLFGSYGDPKISGTCLSSLSQLKQLTSLNLGGYWSQLAQPLQQLLALPLPLRRLQLGFDSQQLHWSDISITHLTALTEFAAQELGNDLTVQLPEQLKTLQLGAAWGKQIDVIFSLQQLRRLAFRVVIDKETLLRFAQLPALQELALAYQDSECESAVANARAWRELPQLRELSVQYECNMVKSRELDKILAGLAADTSLTKLQLTGISGYHDEARSYDSGEDSDDSEDEELRTLGLADGGFAYSVCRSLTRLTLLRDLSIVTGLPAAEMCSGNWLEADDVDALTALTELTRLVLVNRDEEFEDNKVVSLVSKLAQLRELELESCDTYSTQCMAAIGQMKQLTRLRLAGSAQWPDVASQQGLLQLSGLTNLRRLQLCCVAEVASEVMGSLRAALPEARVQWSKWVDEFEQWRRD